MYIVNKYENQTRNRPRFNQKNKSSIPTGNSHANKRPNLRMGNKQTLRDETKMNNQTTEEPVKPLSPIKAGYCQHTSP